MTAVDDIFLPETYAAGIPLDVFQELRSKNPVTWVAEPAIGPWPAGPGYWAVVRYADARQVLHDYETYSSFAGGAQLRDPDTPEDLRFLQSMIVNQDPPDHTRLRRSVSAAFSPRAVRDLEQAIEQRAAYLIDSVIDAGEADYVELVADLPVWTLANLVGMPEPDRPMIYDWTNRVIGYQDDEYSAGSVVDPTTLTDMGRAAWSLRTGPGVQPDGSAINPRSRAALADIFAYARTLAESPAHGSLIATLLTSGLTEDEFELMFFGLILAGTVTLRASAPGGLHALLSHPDELERLRRHPELIGSAVEEMLRYWSPGIMFRRTCTRDTRLGGQNLRKGDKVGVYLISANHDETVFPDPGRFDISRTPNEHVSFGYGPHFCSGAHIARLELRAMIRQTVERLPDLRLAGPPVRMASNFVNGLKHLPIRWENSPRSTRPMRPDQTDAIYAALMRRWVAAINANDLDAMLGVFAHDVRFEDVALHREGHGRQALKALFQDWMDTYAETRARLVSAIAWGDAGVAEWELTVVREAGTAAIQLRGVCVDRLSPDGLIDRHRDYWNAAEMTAR